MSNHLFSVAPRANCREAFGASLGHRPTDAGGGKEGSRMADLARVLIADADQVQRDTLARLLTKAGFRVLQAEAGDQALALARSGTPEAPTFAC